MKKKKKDENEKQLYFREIMVFVMKNIFQIR